MMYFKSLMILALCLSLAACQSVGQTSIGVDGSPTSQLADGPLSGTLGQGLSPRQRNAGFRAEYRALEAGLAGSPVNWSEGTVSGSVTPQQVYQVGSSFCRRYKHEIKIDGEMRSGIGTACRSGEGDWKSLA